MQRHGTDRLWAVATLDGMMNNMMIGMMLLVTAGFGCYLPKLTGQMATLVVPALALLGVVYLFRLPKPQLAIESDSLVYRKGRKVRKFQLAKLKFGYARWNVQVGGVVGSVLIVQEGEESLTIGAYKFMLDNASQYQPKDMEYCEIYMQTEAPFRDFLNHFHARLLALRPQELSTRPQGGPPEAQEPRRLVFDLPPKKNPFSEGPVLLIFGLMGALSIIPSIWILADPLYGWGATAGALLAAILLFRRRKNRKNPELLRVVVEGETLYLAVGQETLSSVPIPELRWSAGTCHISNGRSSWLMPIMVLQFPNHEPLTIGTMSKESWTFPVKDLGLPRFQLGVALWLQLARALGMQQHLR